MKTGIPQKQPIDSLKLKWINNLKDAVYAK